MNNDINLKDPFLAEKEAIKYNKEIKEGDKFSFTTGFKHAINLVNKNKVINNVMPSLPDFKSIRIRKGLTLVEVGRALEFSEGHLSHLENGRIESPSYDMISKLYNFYNKV